MQSFFMLTTKTDQTAQICGLIRVFIGRSSEGTFSNIVAYLFVVVFWQVQNTSPKVADLIDLGDDSSNVTNQMAQMSKYHIIAPDRVCVGGGVGGHEALLMRTHICFHGVISKMQVLSSWKKGLIWSCAIITLLGQTGLSKQCRPRSWKKKLHPITL